jgi:hypothetical protein
VHVVVAVAVATLTLALTCSDLSTDSGAAEAEMAETHGLHGSQHRRMKTFARIGTVGVERIAADDWIYPATAP